MSIFHILSDIVKLTSFSSVEEAWDFSSCLACDCWLDLGLVNEGEQLEMMVVELLKTIMSPGALNSFSAAGS